MQTVSRRDLIVRTTLGAAGLASLVRRLNADPLGLPIGCQTYPVRQAIGTDFEGTMQQLAAIGFKTIELCSPHGYEKAGYGALLKFKPSEVRQKIRSAGLACESSHYNYQELRDHLPERIDYAKELGLKQIILAHSGLRKDATLADWARVAGELNKIGEQTAKAGIQAGFHNHDVEFTKLDGVLIYDKFMAELDPKLVKMQFQTAVARLGFDSVTVFEKYPGRFISLHLQDYAAETKDMVPVGKGAIDWKKLFAAARKAGVKNYFVELNLEQMKESYAYLRGLKV